MKLQLLLVSVCLTTGSLFAQNTMSAQEIEKQQPAIHLFTKGGVTVNSTAFYTEDFDGGLPAEWEVTDSVPSPNNEIWLWSNYPGPITVTAGTDSFSTNGTTAANGFMIYNSDAYGNNTTFENSSLISGAINCSGHPTVYLGFNHYYRDFSNSIGTVFVSSDSTNWTEVITYDASTANPEAASFDISTTAGNQPTVYLRFRYVGSWGWYWMIDDVQLSDSPISGIEDVSGIKALNVYPNPSTGLVIIKSENAYAKQVNIYNATGQMVYSESYEGFSHELDLSGFDKGIYTVKIDENGTSRYQKLILMD